MVAKFLPYLKAHRWQVAWALAQVFLITGFELLKPWPLQIVIDYVLGGKLPAIGGPIGSMLSLPAPVLLAVACIALLRGTEVRSRYWLAIPVIVLTALSLLSVMGVGSPAITPSM